VSEVEDCREGGVEFDLVFTGRRERAWIKRSARFGGGWRGERTLGEEGREREGDLSY